MNKRYLIISLIFPVIVLIALILYRQVRVMTGTKIILPVEGFDPRDILSGHYLTYRIDYGIKNNDQCYDYNNTQNAYVCLEKSDDNAGTYSSYIYSGNGTQGYDALNYNNNCYAIIKGKCSKGRFYAEIEKFYIPEENAQALDKAVRGKRGKIRLMVNKNGSAAIKDLLIDGKSWKELKDM